MTDTGVTLDTERIEAHLSRLREDLRLRSAERELNGFEITATTIADTCDDLLSLRRLAAQSDGWRPIATAPKTTKSILVYCPSRQNTYVVSWGQLTGSWIHFGGGGYELTDPPKWWQPLPSPPSPPSTEDKT